MGEVLDSLASETISSSTVGRGGGGPLLRAGSRLLLRERGVACSAALRKDGAFEEIGVELQERGQTL